MNITTRLASYQRLSPLIMTTCHRTLGLLSQGSAASCYGFCRHRPGSVKPCGQVRGKSVSQQRQLVKGAHASSLAGDIHSVQFRTYGALSSTITPSDYRVGTSCSPAQTILNPSMQRLIHRDAISSQHRGLTNFSGLSNIAQLQQRDIAKLSGTADVIWSQRGHCKNLSRSSDITWMQSRDFMNLFGSSQQTEWARAVSEAEKIVGYSTSFMSLRCLLSDELANVALHMRKLVGTQHPLLKTAKNFLTDGKHTLQTRGLIILLMSKAGNASTHKAPEDAKASSAPTHRAPEDNNAATATSGIYASQRALAEISEMIHTAFLVHHGVVNLLNLDPAIGPIRVMELGNKMAVLSGDFLLASACKALAGLRNTVVVELISKAIAHLTEAAFLPFRNPDSSPVTVVQPDLTFSDWEKYVYLSTGTLIAHSCRGALELTNHSQALTESAFDFGRNIAWAQQLHTELQPFISKSVAHSMADVSLTSAPVILYLEEGVKQDQSSIEEFTSSTKPDVRKLVRTIRRSEVVGRARDLCHSYADTALQALTVFPPSDSRTALQNMVQAVRT